MMQRSSICSVVETDLNFVLVAPFIYFCILSVRLLLGLGGAFVLTVFVMADCEVCKAPSVETLVIGLLQWNFYAFLTLCFD